MLRQQKQGNDMQGTFVADQLTIVDSNEKYNNPYPIFVPTTKKIKNCSKAKWGNIEGISNISEKLSAPYDEITKWAKNLFKVPYGECGQKIVEEATRLLSHYTMKQS